MRIKSQKLILLIWKRICLAQTILAECEKHSISTVSIIEDGYPKLLLEIKDLLLFYTLKEMKSFK